MADIKFLVDDDDNAEEEQEDDGLEDETDDNSMLDKEMPEELISPLTKMDRYMNSEIIFNRRMASRCVLECLRSVKSDEECYTVLQAMVRLSDDIEAAVRIEVMEQIPHVAVLCVEHRGLNFAISRYILPVVVRYLTDPNNQVRKTSQAALLLLLEQEVIERVEIEQQICPVLIQLCSIDSTDDFRTEAVTLMSKMAPMVGREITERYFLGQFDNLCSDPLFHVRKVCAGNFGEICEVVGNELTEKRLLPVFVKLCQDGVWGVRKACAECFMNVSTVASREVRKDRLAPLFINLLGDKSRWVQMAAYQSLGPFISTFADPYNSGFYVDEHGKLCKFVFPVRSEGEGESSSEEIIGDEKKNANDLSLLTESNGIEVKTTDSGYMSPPEAHLDGDLNENQTFDSPVDTETCIDMKPTDAILDTYNSFNYWRMPIPSIFDSDENDDDDNIFEDRNGDMTSGDLKSESDDMSGDDLKQEVDVNEDFSLDKPNQTSDDLPAVDNLGLLVVDTDDNAKDLVCIENVEDSPEQMQPLPAVSSLRLNDDYLQPYSSSISFDDDRNQLSSPPQSPHHEQEVIPQPLLDHFISMTEPSKAQAIDTDLAKHCAFSFPAVTLTLGARNWKCLKDTYEHLSSDMQWKVRRTLAFSIHELSEILGANITRMDLVPIFDNFLKDLDEVRIGVLKNLARFIKLLAPDLRANYLKNYTDFLSTDNARNWRFRYELAEQLIMLVDVYQGAEVSEFICPIALSLGADRVAEVRLISYKLVGILLLKLNAESSSEFRKSLIDEIVEHYASSEHWFRRLSYCQLCEVLLEEDFITAEKFAIDFLPYLLSYQTDEIVNVKLALSRTLTRAVMVTDYFCRPECKDSEKVLEAIERLQSDKDRDVRYFAGRDEEVPYEGRRYSDDESYIKHATSHESLEQIGQSPLEDKSAEEQLRAKLSSVETSETRFQEDIDDEQVIEEDAGLQTENVEEIDGLDEQFDDQDVKSEPSCVLNEVVKDVVETCNDEKPQDIQHLVVTEEGQEKNMVVGLEL